MLPLRGEVTKAWALMSPVFLNACYAATTSDSCPGRGRSYPTVHGALRRALVQAAQDVLNNLRVLDRHAMLLAVLAVSQCFVRAV
jgi:hypothetical protein